MQGIIWAESEISSPNEENIAIEAYLLFVEISPIAVTACFSVSVEFNIKSTIAWCDDQYYVKSQT